MSTIVSKAFLTTTESGQVSTPNVGFDAVVLIAVVGTFMVWMSYLWLNSRRPERQQRTPPNLQPGISDEVLESNKLTRVLTIAVVTSAVLAGAMGVYYSTESGRQSAAAEEIAEKDIEEGEKWFDHFSCINCHSPGAVGGGAEFNEPRSNLNTTWAAPSLNDLFLRYQESEVRTIIDFGRDGTPMPANGLPGGGALTVQEVDQVMAYLEHIQISQGEALDQVDSAVQSALTRLSNTQATIENLIAAKEAELEDIYAAETQFGQVGTFEIEVQNLLQADGKCTRASANLVGSSCSNSGYDTDRDGLSDVVETELTRYAARLQSVVKIRQGTTLELVDDPQWAITFDPNDPFTNNTVEGEGIPDLVEAGQFLTSIGGTVLPLSLATSKQALFVEQIESGLTYLRTALEERNWEVDFETVAAATDLSEDDARRAVGLFNAYCARCHTAGYSAGAAFQQRPGTGAWGPALTGGRAEVQFPNAEDQLDFIISGSDLSVNFGVNGLGTGRMPAFGRILSKADIMLIMAYERSM